MCKTAPNKMHNSDFTPSHDGTFGIYLNSIRHNQRLSEEQVVDLLNRYQQTGDINDRNRVVESYLLYVLTLAKAYQTEGFDLQDLIQEGNIGLIVAADHFSPYYGIPFIFYAAFWIRKYITEFIRQYESNISRPAQSSRKATPVSSLDKPLADNNDFTLQDKLATDEINSFEEQQHHEYVSKIIIKALETLSIQEEQVLRLTYGIGCHPEFDYTIAEIVGYKSTERVQRVREQTLRKLFYRIDKNQIY